MSIADLSYVRFDSEELDLKQAQRDLSFAGIRNRLDEGILVPEDQKDSAREILYDSQGYGEK